MSRAATGSVAFFEGYTGKITCDAYAVHEELLPLIDGVPDDSRMYNCWVHTLQEPRLLDRLCRGIIVPTNTHED